MSLLQSLFLKLGMLAMTMGVVWWIGWEVPQTMQRPVTARAAAEVAVVAASSAGDAVAAPVTQQEVPRPASRSQRVDLNLATAAEFDQIPGVGPVLARRMVEYRKSAGRFYAVEDLKAVKGIGKKKLERLKPFVTVVASPGHDEGKKGPI